MNGVNKLKICKSNGRNEDNGEEEEEDEIDIQPSTSRAGLMEEPKWNTSTRQLYDDNFKSSSSSGNPNSCASWVGGRERIPSATESTSSDDSCVYMYKGDGSNRNGNDINKHVTCSSPEMDYLEMDFDPCQSNGHESSDGSYSCDVGDLKEEENNDTSECPLNLERNSTPTNEESRIPSPHLNYETPVNSESPQPSTSKVELITVLVDKKLECSNTFPNHCAQGPKTDLTLETEIEIAETETINALLQSHLSEGPFNRACCLSNINEAMCLMYGLGAILEDEESLQDLLKRHEVMCSAEMPITEFLSEMSNGFVTIPLLENSIKKIFGGTVITKFFAPYPTSVNLSSWLQCWTKRGAVALLCWNFHLTQDDCNLSANPSWHYQLVYSTTTSVGIHVVSQDELIHEKTLKRLLTNPAEVLIHRDAVMAHWNPHSDLVPLVYTSDYSWKQYNVLGQVANVIRESATGKSDDEIQYVRVPSNHKAGILILMHTSNIHIQELLAAESFSV